jgi:hypothetical protein
MTITREVILLVLKLKHYPFLCRHLSAVSVEDLSGGEPRPVNSEMQRPISATKKTMSVSEIRVRKRRGLYTSAENLPGAGQRVGEGGLRRPMSSMERTSSCIDLVTDYDKFPEKKRFVSRPNCCPPFTMNVCKLTLPLN